MGGAELSPAAYVPIVEEIAKHDASAAWCLGQACGCSMTAAYFDPAIAREHDVYVLAGRRGRR
jgi:indole-3-acetate monooxygenase